ncbi:glycosyltransferase family 4 protein [Sporolactobacillus spathodeae]|uniref:Glycosyltransferase involved in cell wall biosynthesis n=1 Tax=Sporolactobacillus spathodeae TaxID=1465502 RepID=A0ABS2QBF9_9BACL|nr:glycosyltransferase family 4 protein [Sporolactobacillus spathodeae]MBM7659147.1 glycosyltransferase involved in cell wall biosynthesis [Sporolactobacillus spathodeae]
MKIAFICSDRGPCPPVRGGAIQLLIAKVAPLLAKSHKVTVYSITDPALNDQETIDQVVYERYNPSQFFQQVCDSVRKKAFDVIQIYNRPGWVGLIRNAAPNAKILLSLHNLVYQTLKVDHEQAVRGLKEADRILTVSRFVAEDTAKKFPGIREKIHVLYTGVSINDYAPVWSGTGKQWRQQIRALYHIRAQDPVLLFVGRLVSAKGCHLLLQAMEDLLSDQKQVKLLVVGSKWYADESSSAYIDKLKHRAEQMQGNVIFTAYIPLDAIPKYFAAADLFICPSQWEEPLARVHYEAMAAGLPIITTDRGGNAELFQPGRDALIIENYKEPKAFVTAITTLLENPELAGRMGRIGRKKVEKTYNFARVATDLQAIYAALQKPKK